jgi:hypothetical protein
MNSGSHRGFTVVTIVTMFFAPFLVHHHWAYGLVSVKTETHTEQCATVHHCPAFRTIVVRVKPPLPPNPPRTKGDDSSDASDSTTVENRPFTARH